MLSTSLILKKGTTVKKKEKMGMHVLKTTSWKEAPLRKAVLALLVKNFPLFHATRKFSTVFPTASSWLLCKGSWIKNTI